MKKLSTYIEESEMLFEMVNLGSKTTGLDFVVWVQVNTQGQAHGKHNTPRLKIRNKDREFIPVSISDTPEFLGGCTLVQSGISSKQFKQLCEWIKLNKSTLIDYWNEKIETVEDLQEQLKIL